MQLLVETGPVVNGQNVGMSLSNRHHRRLIDLLLDWYWSLPAEVSCRIERIWAAPSKLHYPSVRVEVSLAGEYERGGGETEADGMRAWKSSFGYSFPYRPQYVTDNHYKPNCFDPELAERLTNRLRETLGKEYEALQALHKSLMGPIRALNALGTGAT